MTLEERITRLERIILAQHDAHFIATSGVWDKSGFETATTVVKIGIADLRADLASLRTREDDGRMTVADNKGGA